MALADFFGGGRDGKAGVIQLPAVCRAFCGRVIKSVVKAGITALDMEVLRLVYPVKLLVLALLPLFRREVNALFLADLGKVAVNVGNQAIGGFIDGFQTGAQFFQLSAF